MKRCRLPKYCSEFQDRHGKWRVRFRRKGQETNYFKSPVWSEQFMQEYAACLAGEAAPKIEPGASHTKPGSVSSLVASYYRSPEFRGLAPSTQATYRGIIERFRAEHGDKRVALIERQHIKAIIGAKAATPAAANNLLQRIKTLMGLAVDIGMRHHDPTHRLKGFRIRNDGFHTWTDEEIAQFEVAHPIGTKARLAFSLLLFTGQRRGDVVVMGRQHVSGDRISVCQRKTTVRLSLPIHPTLQAVLFSAPSDNLTFLTTEFGKPFSPAGFGNWFRERCNEPGLNHCSAHGLRKAASRRLAEAGATNQQITAVTGYRTDKEVSRYTAAADQGRLADQAFNALKGAERERNLANPDERLANLSGNILKTRDS